MRHSVVDDLTRNEDPLQVLQELLRLVSLAVERLEGVAGKVELELVLGDDVGLARFSNSL